MTRSLSETQAESHESQDSQTILEAYRAEFGVGAIRSSPPPRSFQFQRSSAIRQIQAAIGASRSPRERAIASQSRSDDAYRASRWGSAEGPKKQLYAQEAANNVTDPTNQSERFPNETRAGDVTGTANADASLQCIVDDASEPPIEALSPPIADSARPPSKRMDASQETPTQVNDDRDYNEYCSLVPSSPVNGTPTQPLSHEPRPFLLDDDTGIVNFSLESQHGRRSSQVSEDGGFDNTRGDWRLPTEETSQQPPGSAYTPRRPQNMGFETPAPSKNPFSAKASVSAPLAGSQLFGQTQFSSAIKKISPTSSRPTPRIQHYSMSPIVETSPLKNRVNLSSPTNIPTPSLQGSDGIPATSSRENDESERPDTPLKNKSTGADLIPASPNSIGNPIQYPRFKSTGNTGLIEYYEPVKKSQERKSIEEPLPSCTAFDSDSDDPIRRIQRRKRAEMKRAKAARELEKIEFIPRPPSDSDRPRSRKRRRVMSDVPANSTSSSVQKAQEAKGKELRVVGDCQNPPAPLNEIASAGSDEAIPQEAPVPVDAEGDANMNGNEDEASIYEDRIPATSPMGSLQPTDQQGSMMPEPELPTLVMEEDRAQEASTEPGTSSLPLPRRATTRAYGRARRQQRRNPLISSSNSEGWPVEAGLKAKDNSSSIPDTAPGIIVDEIGQGRVDQATIETQEDQDQERSSGTKQATPQKPQSGLPPPMTTRSHQSESRPTTPITRRTTGAGIPTSSSLSVLSNTPELSCRTSPSMQGSPASDKPDSMTPPSPRRSLRKSTLGSSIKSESPQPMAARATRMAKLGPRLDSESTDELHYSPSVGALERSIIQTKSNRSFRQSFGSVPRTGRLFEGMVFAVTFQSSQVKQNERTKLETKITQAGGTILAEGFQGLFETPAVMSPTSPVIDNTDPLRLTKTSCDSGFTALIADGHSRKAKYMQALALGLPCLAHQWIFSCLNKDAIVDWEPYVLCAGESAVLGNAMRSRSLIPYPAVGIRLADVIDQRPLLLEGQRILVVVDSKKARSVAKGPYIFLAKALGPSISRVFTAQQAREALLDHEKAGSPFDWLYVDKGTSTVDAVLRPPEGGNKKRKRSPGEFKMGNMRVLDDELVIQSLILGRVVEEGEMDS